MSIPYIRLSRERIGGETVGYEKGEINGQGSAHFLVTCAHDFVMLSIKYDRFV